MAGSLQLIDTHTHLTMDDFTASLDQVLARSRQVGVDRWVTIGTNLTDSAAGINLCQSHEDLYCTVGIHPHEAAHQPADWPEQLRTLAQTEVVCALGEIGLDYYYDHSPRETQRDVFARQLQIAGELALPVVIHCRDAIDDCLEILDDWRRHDIPVVFHCFSGNANLAELIIERGYYISFTGVITFKNSQSAQQTAQAVPIDRIMLETDCPYMSPEPKRNVKPNEPALLVHIAQQLAQLRGLDLTEIARITTENSRLFFGIDQ